jgi:hypothetical protein
MKNTKKDKKKKWYDTWWGLLWTLAIVDAVPGRGLQTFMEVDRELNDLSEVSQEVRDQKPSLCVGRLVTETCKDMG